VAGESASSSPRPIPPPPPPDSRGQGVRLTPRARPKAEPASDEEFEDDVGEEDIVGDESRAEDDVDS
jgi:hypothetical protein